VHVSLGLTVPVIPYTLRHSLLFYNNHKYCQKNIVQVKQLFYITIDPLIFTWCNCGCTTDCNSCITYIGQYTNSTRSYSWQEKEAGMSSLQMNVSLHSGTPERMLEPAHVLEDLLHDKNHENRKKITHLHSWQFFLFPNCLKNLIIRPSFNNQSLNVGLVPKHDHHHQLFFLHWNGWTMVIFTGQERLLHCKVIWSLCSMP